MTLIFKEEYTFNVEVTVYLPKSKELPSNKSPQTFIIQARAVSEDTIRNLIQDVSPKEIDTTLCLYLITGWQAILNENKQEMPFNKENLKKVIAHPFIRGAILSAYWHALYESRLKN